MASDAENKVPLKVKLQAWWGGYDAAELDARLRALVDGEEPGEAPAPAKKAAPEPLDPSVPFDPWDRKRVDISQYIWGDGFCGPGGPEHIIVMSKLLALSPEMSMMDIGARLGGPARTLADKFGVWVTGYEESAQLVESGNELSVRAGMGKKATLHEFKPEETTEFDRTFDRALAKEALVHIQNKQQVITATFKSMKDEGMFLITDYVLGSKDAANSQGYKEWVEMEPHGVYPVVADELSKMLEDAGFSVRVNEDQSDEHIAMIASAWAGADKVIAKLVDEEDGPAMVDMLLKEAEYWAKRSELLKDGTLRMWRMLGYKKTSELS